MINKNILNSVFDTYGINKVTLIEENNEYIFLISNMPSNINLDRWEYLENILKDITQKNVSILALNYAKKYINLEKGLVIK